MMDIIELDHIILSFTADTHSYSQKGISAEAQQKQEGLMTLKPLETAFDYSLYLFLIRLLISPPANIKCIRWSYRRLNTLETKASFPQQSGHPRPLAID